MNKNDLLVVVVLFVLLLTWPGIYRKLAPSTPSAEKPAPPAQECPTPDQTEEHDDIERETIPAESQRSTAGIGASETEVCGESIELTNDFLKVTISSAGGGVAAAELKKYRATNDPASGPVRFEFLNEKSASYTRLPGFSAGDVFNVCSSSWKSVVMERTNDNGLHLKRSITLGEDYLLKIEDVFSNNAEEPRTVPQHLFHLASLSDAEIRARSAGQHNFGVDVLLSAGGEGVKHWSSKLPGLFKTARKERRLPRLPETITISTNTPADWVAAKNKFFVQILEPDTESSGYVLRAGRRILPGESGDSRVNPRNAEVNMASVSLILPDFQLNSGEERILKTSYYIGPKKLSILENLGLHKDQIMEFGWWSPLCKILLRVLNAIHSLIPSYGMAILLLTILIRILFWPLTHKSSESMKKMQELQPQMLEIRKKYENNPKLMQAETMALYKRNKVNPMSGCLPMLIQIPVFIALFVVLRSAIELRFADFLWIKDLSAPERLLADVLPIPLNILPIIMAVTMAWQQMLTPTSDPNQQKIMAIFMPAMMLVMFYNMPSALVLYWSASQCIMIGQQLIQKKRAGGGTSRRKQA